MKCNLRLIAIQLILGVGALLTLSLAIAQEQSRTTWTDAYVEDVRDEKPTKYIELPEVPEVAPDTKPPLKDRIFDQKLTAEIRSRYERKFGLTPVDQVRTYSNNYYFDLSGSSDPSKPQVFIMNNELSEEASHTERKFGEFMLRRMAEYHVDDYTRNDPQLKTVYQVKNNASKMNVTFKKGWKVMTNYSISANELNVRLLNPYVDSRVEVQMDENSIGPNRIQETTISLERQMTTKVRSAINYKLIDGKVELVNRRRLNENMEATLTTGVSVKGSGYTHRDNLIVAGWSWTGW